jgi:ubiquitin-like protein Pup
MSQQESAERRTSKPSDTDDAAVAPAEMATSSNLDSDVDSILDEIDSVLEENAEDFVKSFVQKGGQ